MEENNDNYTISYNLYDAENYNFSASGAIDLRSNRNRLMILSRRKFSQQTRKWRSVDFLLISLSRHFSAFLTWF